MFCFKNISFDLGHQHKHNLISEMGLYLFTFDWCIICPVLLSLNKKNLAFIEKWQAGEKIESLP